MRCDVVMHNPVLSYVLLMFASNFGRGKYEIWLHEPAPHASEKTPEALVVALEEQRVGRRRGKARRRWARRRALGNRRRAWDLWLLGRLGCGWLLLNCRAGRRCALPLYGPDVFVLDPAFRDVRAEV